MQKIKALKEDLKDETILSTRLQEEDEARLWREVEDYMNGVD